MSKFIITMRNSFFSSAAVDYLLEQGFDDFRLNMGRFIDDRIISYVDYIRQIADKKGKKVTFFFDLPGAKARIRCNGKGVMVRSGDRTKIRFTNENVDEYHIFNSEWLIPELRKGDVLQIGRAEAEVNAVSKDYVDVTYLCDKVVKNSESVYVKNREIVIDHLTEADMVCLHLLLKLKCDYIAPSFVTHYNVPLFLKEYMKRADYRTKVISKIESLKGLEQIDSIMYKSDGIMFGRDDLSRVLSEQLINRYISEFLNEKRQEEKMVITASSYFANMVNKTHLHQEDIELIERLIKQKVDKIVINETTFSENWKEIIQVAKRLDC